MTHPDIDELDQRFLVTCGKTIRARSEIRAAGVRESYTQPAEAVPFERAAAKV